MVVLLQRETFHLKLKIINKLIRSQKNLLITAQDFRLEEIRDRFKIAISTSFAVCSLAPTIAKLSLNIFKPIS